MDRDPSDDGQSADIPQRMKVLRQRLTKATQSYWKETRETRSPNVGGCWICHTGNGFEEDNMAFDMEFDTFYHPLCLRAEGVDSIVEYERTREREVSVER